MKRLLVLVTVFVIVFATVPTSSDAQLTSIRKQEYYTDSAFSNLVGEEVAYCDGTYTSWGTLFTQYKILYRISCDETQEYSHTCWQSNGSGGYTQISCPF